METGKKCIAASYTTQSLGASRRRPHPSCSNPPKPGLSSWAALGLAGTTNEHACPRSHLLQGPGLMMHDGI